MKIIILGAGQVGVSMAEMLSAVRAVRRGSSRAMLVADMPFGSYQVSLEASLTNAIDFLKAGAEAVKLEGGARRSRLVSELSGNGIPVMGHIGLTPQSVHAMGGYKVQGKIREDAQRLLAGALVLLGGGRHRRARGRRAARGIAPQTRTQTLTHAHRHEHNHTETNTSTQRHRSTSLDLQT